MSKSFIIEVTSYSGYKAEERPSRFRLGNEFIDVIEVLDRWYEPEYVYFKVRAGDNNVYILKHNEPDDIWELTFYRKSR